MLDCIFDKIVVKSMTCSGPIGTKLYCEWSANATKSCAIVGASSFRIGSVFVLTDGIPYVSTVVTKREDVVTWVLGIVANRGGALRSWQGEFVSPTFEHYNSLK